MTMQRLSAMLAPIVFRLPSGRDARPMQFAPWADEIGSAVLPDMLRRLRGEWPCAPFAATSDRPAPPDWPQDVRAEPDEEAHGYGCNREWDLEWGRGGALVARIACPATSTIAELERRVTPVPGKARVAASVALHADTPFTTCHSIMAEEVR